MYTDVQTRTQSSRPTFRARSNSRHIQLSLARLLLSPPCQRKSSHARRQIDRQGPPRCMYAAAVEFRTRCCRLGCSSRSSSLWVIDRPPQCCASPSTSDGADASCTRNKTDTSTDDAAATVAVVVCCWYTLSLLLACWCSESSRQRRCCLWLLVVTHSPVGLCPFCR